MSIYSLTFPDMYLLQVSVVMFKQKKFHPGVISREFFRVIMMPDPKFRGGKGSQIWVLICPLNIASRVFHIGTLFEFSLKMVAP